MVSRLIGCESPGSENKLSLHLWHNCPVFLVKRSICTQVLWWQIAEDQSSIHNDIPMNFSKQKNPLGGLVGAEKWRQEGVFNCFPIYHFVTPNYLPQEEERVISWNERMKDQKNSSRERVIQFFLLYHSYTQSIHCCSLKKRGHCNVNGQRRALLSG